MVFAWFRSTLVLFVDCDVGFCIAVRLFFGKTSSAVLFIASTYASYFLLILIGLMVLSAPLFCNSCWYFLVKVSLKSLLLVLGVPSSVLWWVSVLDVLVG